MGKSLYLFRSRLNVSLIVASMQMGQARDKVAESLGLAEPPTEYEIELIRTLSQYIAERAAVIMAVTVYTLWRLQYNFSQQTVDTAAHAVQSDQPIAVAYCGAVADRHPGVRQKCQEVLDLLVQLESGKLPRQRLVLEAAPAAGILGAAVGAIQNCQARERS